MDSTCDQAAGPAKFKLRIVPRLKVEPGATADSIMGFAVGNMATVSYHWGEGADPYDDPIAWEILADVIAHEIGHLLLGANSHSPTGIMMGEWSPEELRGAAWGRLRFTPHQAELLRAEVQSRRNPETRSADLKVSVRVYNYAGISADTLRLAESDAARIFAMAEGPSGMA